jgi:hypothetical protein
MIAFFRKHGIRVSAESDPWMGALLDALSDGEAGQLVQTLRNVLDAAWRVTSVDAVNTAHPQKLLDAEGVELVTSGTVSPEAPGVVVRSVEYQSACRGAASAVRRLITSMSATPAATGEGAPEPEEKAPDTIPIVKGFAWTDIEREILSVLYMTDLSCPQIVAKIATQNGREISQSTIQDALRTTKPLRKSGVVLCERRGVASFYYRSDAPPIE